MIKKCFFLFLFIPLNVYAAALLEEKLVIDKESMTPSSKTAVSYVETTPVKSVTSPYQSLSQGDTNLLKPISKIEEKIKEEQKVYFTVTIPDKVRLEFDESLYYNIKRELEKIARYEKRELEERRRKILLEKQKLVEIEAEKIKELKIKIAQEEKERFEEKTELIEEEIEQELARRKATREEKILASKKIEEEILAKEKYIKEQKRKAQLETKRKADEEKIDKQRKEEEKKRLAEEQKEAERLKQEELKKAKREKQEEKKKKEEKEKKELEEYKEVDLDKMLDRELPADTKLTIDGTKIIDIKVGNSEYLDSKRRKNKEKPAGFTSGIDIHQELTVKLKGVIKEKINVNVDYSDIDNNKKQNFYINYQGDKKEVIQKVEFGDVKFTAPNTEFVGYNQQVFGVSAEAKVGKKTNLWGIASRSKGIRVTKEFKGDKRIVNINSVDTAYISQKYYHLLPAEIGTIIPPITLEAVYIDDKNGQNNETPRNIGATAIVSIPTVGTNIHSGRFDIQYAGEDYVFDSDTKILTFEQSIGRGYIVGVVFKDNQGNYFPSEYSGDKNNPEMILMIEPGVADIEYDVFELKNYYSLGGKNIPADTEIKLKIIDESGKNFLDMNEKNGRKDGDEYDYLQIFGLDNDFNGKIDDYADYDYIDHEAGIIKFPDPTPFEIGTGSNPFLKIQTHVDKLRNYFENLSVTYDQSQHYSKQHKYTIIGSYTLKVKNYMLGYLNIVEGSELVYVDGNLLKKDTDYFIDYDTGFLTFMPHINITEYTTIKIDYEYTPFIGTKYQKTIAGLRGEFKPNDNFSIGSTYLYEGAPKLKKIPKVSDPMLGNLQVIDVNTSIKVIPILKNLFKIDNNLPVDMTISGEVAKSFKNKNTFGSAIIDSMEGVEDSRKISMDETAWQLSSLPKPNLSRGKLLYRKDSSGNLMLAPSYRPITEISGPYDYKENVQWEEDDTVDEKVLNLYYTNLGTNSWISIVHPLSNTPLSFTDYTHLEVWIREQDINKIDELYIDLGEISEHADGTGTINRAPHTEDTSPKDYILNKGEDGGWQFKYPDGVVTKVGADNNQLDTEDLDGNGILTTKEEYFELRFKEFKGTVTIKNPINNWRLWSIPLSNASIGTGTPRWSAIKQIRLRFKGIGTETTGEIRIGGMAFVGSGRWTMGTVTPAGIGTFNVSSKNAEDDAYDSLRNRSEYKDLYPDEDMKREEALVLKYELERAIIGTITVGTQTMGTTTIYSKGYTYRTFYTAQNYNDYQYLKFWLYGDKQGGKFFVRFGLDENNYFGYTLPIDFSGWKLISINLDDFKDKLIELIEEGKRTGTKTPPYNYAQLPYGYEAKNNPVFENIKWISVGIENISTTKSISGEIYVNDIHLSQAKKSEGLARKVAINTKFKDYLTINFSEKIIDSEFECIGRTPQVNETKRQDLSLNFTKIKFLPVGYQWYKNISKLDPTKEKNLLSESCGETSEKYQKISINFKVKELVKNIKRFPNITINTWADRKTIDTDRRDKKEDESYENLHGDTSYDYNYTFPKKIFKWIPTGQNLSLSSTYKHNEDWAKKQYKVEKTKNERILTRSQDEILTLKFTPIKTLNGASTIKAAQILKKIHTISQNDTKYYLTSRTLEQSFDRVVYSGIPFFNPRLDTGMKYVESYSGTSTPNRRKDINTSAHLGLTVEKPLNPFEWYPKLKYWPRYKLFTFTPKFTLDVTANYNGISAELSSFECIKKIYSDYYKGQLLKGEGPNTGQYPSWGGKRISAGNKRISNLRSNWYTNWKPLEKTSLNYTRTDDKSQNQNSISQTLTNACDLDIGINLLTALHRFSKLLGTGPSDKTYFNTKYTWTKTEANQTTIKTDITPSINWTRKWKEGLNTEFTLTHLNSKTKKEGGKKDWILNTTPNFKITHKIQKPKPVKLPFGRKITLQRSLETNTTLKIELQKNGTDNRVTKNLNAYSLDMSGSYDLQKNVKGTLGGKLGYTRNKLEKDKDFYGYEGRFRVEFRF